MTAGQRPDPVASGFTSGERARRRGKLVGVALSSTVLVLLNLVTAYFAVLAWIVTPDGAYDRDVLTGIGVLTLLGTGLALVTALLTFIAVKARWLGRRWFIVPVVLFVVATARWVYIDVVYPDLPEGYGFGQMAVPVVGEPHA